MEGTVPDLKTWEKTGKDEKNEPLAAVGLEGSWQKSNR